MLSNTIQDVFSFLLDMLSSVIQVIVWPINQIITLTLPDLSTKIIDVSNTIGTMFDSISWALGVVPSSIIVTLIFIISVEIARHSIYISTHLITKVWEIIQRVKFW